MKITLNVRAIQTLQTQCYDAANRAGWWNDKDTNQPLDPNIVAPIKIALIHSEVSEILEAHRKDLPSEKIHGFSGMEEECADAIHRILDMAEALGLRVGEAMEAKMNYNESRLDHKKAHRNTPNGKKY